MMGMADTVDYVVPQDVELTLPLCRNKLRELEKGRSVSQWAIVRFSPCHDKDIQAMESMLLKVSNYPADFPREAGEVGMCESFRFVRMDG